MNVPDQHRCEWLSAGVRCACPASISTSQFCVFHRNHSSVDPAQFVEWSQTATAEEYIEEAKRFIYRRESPSVIALRERMERHRAGDLVGMASRRSEREPGSDIEEAAA